MTGRRAALSIVIAALLAGAAMFYLQVYAFYSRVTLDALPVARADGTSAALPLAAFEGIDAASSPIRFRACLTPAAMPDPATLVPYPAAEPLNGPFWFSCYDAAALGAALADGSLRAYLAQPDVHWGIDRVVAFDAAGQGWAWHQINRCGRAVFDGNPAPEGCPPRPAS